MPPTIAEPLTDDLTSLAASFARHLRGEHKSARTVEIYLAAISRLADYLAEQGMPRAVRSIRRR